MGNGVRAATLLLCAPCAWSALACSSKSSPAAPVADAGLEAAPPADAQAPAPDAGEDAAPDAGLCSPIAGACADATHAKCAVVSSGASAVLACVPASGTNGNGSSCVRDPGGAPADYGRDDCGPGLFCASLGVLQPTPPAVTQLRCRRYCAVAKDCDVAQQCHVLPSSPPYGYCVPSCALFSNDCGSGVDCSDVASSDALSYTVSCRSLGAANAGDPCTSNLDCATALACVANACTALCDAAHACATGTCAALPGLPGGGGVCK